MEIQKGILSFLKYINTKITNILDSSLYATALIFTLQINIGHVVSSL